MVSMRKVSISWLLSELLHVCMGRHEGDVALLNYFCDVICMDASYDVNCKDIEDNVPFNVFHCKNQQLI